MARDKEAQKALQAEKQGLIDQNVFNLSEVREWSEVAAEARTPGSKKAHVARIFGFVVEKNIQFKKGDEQRKIQGRIVFQGNEIRSEN